MHKNPDQRNSYPFYFEKLGDKESTKIHICNQLIHYNIFNIKSDTTESVLLTYFHLLWLKDSLSIV